MSKIVGGLTCQHLHRIDDLQYKQVQIRIIPISDQNAGQDYGRISLSCNDTFVSATLFPP